jgi:hypothetical protein
VCQPAPAVSIVVVKCLRMRVIAFKIYHARPHPRLCKTSPPHMYLFVFGHVSYETVPRRSKFEKATCSGSRERGPCYGQGRKVALFNPESDRSPLTAPFPPRSHMSRNHGYLVDWVKRDCQYGTYGEF